MANWDPLYIAWVYEIIVLALITLSFLTISCRIYVRIYLRGFLFSIRSWHWSDILLCLTWAIYTTSCLMRTTVKLRWGWWSGNLDEHQDDPNYMTAKHILFHYITVFWVGIFVVKGAMLCFFDEFINKYNKYKSWIIIRVTGVLVAIGGTSSLVYQLTWCLPMERQWALAEDNCWFDETRRLKFTLYRQSWHVILDLIILALPIPMIPLFRTLSMKQKVGLGIMLTLGLFCVASAITFTVAVMNWDDGGLQQPQASLFVSLEPIIELPAAMILQCVPAIRYVLCVRRRPLGNVMRRSVKELGGKSDATSKDSELEDLKGVNPAVTRFPKFPDDCEAGPSRWWEVKRLAATITVRSRSTVSSGSITDNERTEAEMFSIGRV